jgi:hypothetical protein
VGKGGNVKPYSKISKAKKGCQCDTSDGMLSLQELGPEFKPPVPQKIKINKIK